MRINSVSAAGVTFLVFSIAPGCAGQSSSNAVHRLSPPQKMVVEGSRVGFDEERFLTTYEQTWDIRHDPAASAFANTSLQNHAAIQLQDKQVVKVTEKVDVDRYGQDCHISIDDDDQAWVQCSWLGAIYAAKPTKTTSLGVIDADDADAQGNPVGYLFPTKREMCAYTYAAERNAKTRPIPADAIVLTGRQEIRARAITFLENYGCTDSFGVAAGYVEVLEGSRKGAKGWTAAFSGDE